ncbi:hypothetical protein U1Q18_010492 [Sarracenia purpurea var. burkii]
MRIEGTYLSRGAQIAANTVNNGKADETLGFNQLDPTKSVQNPQELQGMEINWGEVGLIGSNLSNPSVTNDDISVALPNPDDGIYRLCEVRHSAYASRKDAKRPSRRTGRTLCKDVSTRYIRWRRIKEDAPLSLIPY